MTEVYFKATLGSNGIGWDIFGYLNGELVLAMCEAGIAL